MRLHSRILLQICFVDIVLTVLMEIVQPIYIIDAGIFITYLNGPLMQNIASPTWRFLFYDAWLFGYVFALLGLCTQFVYRYLLLVREWRVSLFSYFLMLSLAFFCAFIFCCISYFAFASKIFAMIHNVRIAQLLSIKPDDEAVPLAISAKIKDAWTIFTFFVCVAMNLVANTIIVFCGYRMYRHVQQKTKQYTDELKRLDVLNKQMTRTLVALAIPPLLLMVVNMMICAFIVFFPPDSSVNGSHFQSVLVVVLMLILLPSHWLPVVNPLITVLIVQQYRQPVIKVFRRLMPTPNTTVTVTTVAIKLQVPSPTGQIRHSTNGRSITIPK
ncbi:hypothetical protein GPALN_013267 [Globodera pallida]|nr:hypothetical protein GPALN_013267 [Globodera pallida]